MQIVGESQFTQTSPSLFGIDHTKEGVKEEKGTIENLLSKNNLGLEEALDLLIEKFGQRYQEILGFYHRYAPDIGNFAIFGDEPSSCYIGLLNLNKGSGITAIFSDKGNEGILWISNEIADLAYYLMGVNEITKFHKENCLDYCPIFDERLRWLFVVSTKHNEKIPVAVYSGLNNSLERYAVVGRNNASEQRTIRLSDELSGKYAPVRWREIPLNPKSQARLIGSIISQEGYDAATLEEGIKKEGLKVEPAKYIPPKLFPLSMLTMY